MNALRSVYCRLFQGALRAALPLLPYRDPVVLGSMDAAARMLRDKIDVTAFLTWYVEHYPESQRLWSEMPNHPAVPSFR